MELKKHTDKKTYIRLEGADSFYCLYVNGNYAGCHMISHSGAEFDISQFIISGENKIELLVTKWSTGAYFEDQDKLRMSGVFRDVYILIRPEGHIFDYFVKQEISRNCSLAQISVEFPETDGTEKSIRLEYEGKTLFEKSFTKDNIAIKIDNPNLWSAENPCLYDLIIKSVREKIKQRVALRDIRVENGVVMLNGQKIKFRGVNRHESYYDTGCVVSKDKIIADIKLMKENNINAIRASHYPNAGVFYYGGDFGEKDHDYNYCVDGLVSHKREGFSSLAEVKQAFKPIRIKKENNKFILENRFAFTDLKEIFSIKVTDENNCPYLMPQEYGSHFDTNYIEICSENRKITIEAPQGVSFSVLKYSPAQLKDCAHEFELKDESAVFLSIDYKMSGVGSGSVGPKFDKKYQLCEKEFDFSFVIKFFENTESRKLK